MSRRGAPSDPLYSGTQTALYRPGCLAYRRGRLARASRPMSATWVFLRDVACPPHSVLRLAQSKSLAGRKVSS